MFKRLWIILLMIGVLTGFGALPAWSDEIGELKSEIEALKQGQKVMQKDLNDIKALLRALDKRNARPAPKLFNPTDVSLDGASILGHADAPVTIVEFTDYQCPFCRRHANGTFGQIVKDYVDSGKVRYVVRQFPLRAIHPKAIKASEASLCAGDQGKYWEMHHKIFKETRTFGQEEWVRHAEALGLDMDSFKDCLESGKNASRVEQDLKAGSALGIRGTPGFFIGKSDPDDPKKFKAVEFLRGAYGFPKFKQAIDKLLKPS